MSSAMTCPNEETEKRERKKDDRITKKEREI
jgi:hypothetical protein